VADTPQSSLTDLPNSQVSFDIEAFDDAIRSHGVLFTHWRAMRCPVGLVDPYDPRRPHDDHSGCSNGYLYTTAGNVTALFVGNSMETTIAPEAGVLDAASAQITIPRFYDGSSTPVHVAPFDRLYLSNPEILVPNWQTFRHSGTARDKLSFPAEEVQDLVDSFGRRYQQGVDFEVRGGVIHWGANTPGMDATSGKGLVCSVRYNYRPYWYIKRLLHEIRVTQADDQKTGRRVLTRMPQAALLQREYVFEKEANDPEAPDPNSLRQVPLPEETGWRY